MPDNFEFGILGQGVSLIGGGIMMGFGAAHGAGGGAIIAGAAVMNLAAGLGYIPFTSYKDDVEKEGDLFKPGDVRIGSFDISSPIFSTQGGQTMCPHQDLEYTYFYRNEQGDSTVIHERTMQREKPSILVEPSEVHNVPITDKAFFNLKLTNNTETGDDQWYGVTVLDGTNPNGASIRVDGLNIKRTYFVPANTTLNKSLSLAPTNKSVMEYDSVGIAIFSTCQAEPTDYMRDIIDITYISASFQPSCTNVELLEPLDNWVVNVRDNDTMTVRLGGYNLAYDSFQSFRFEYKPSSGNIWVPVKYFVNNPDLKNTDDITDTLLMRIKG